MKLLRTRLRFDQHEHFASALPVREFARERNNVHANINRTWRRLAAISDRCLFTPSYSQPTLHTPMNTRLKRRKINFSIPGEASEIFDNYRHRLRHFYANEREFCESVVAYALWCEREHHLTGPSFRDRTTRQKMWEEIIADYGKPKKAGSYFEHRMEEIIAGRENKI